jgi:predicted dehydrogenase
MASCEQLSFRALITPTEEKMNIKHKAILIGCGGMSGPWLTALRDHYSERVEVVGLVDLFEKSAAARAAEFKLDKAFVGTSLEAAVQATGADLVFNCTVPEAHVATCQTALEAGCDVLVEKPVALTVADGEKLCQVAERVGKTLAVIQNRRYLPGAVAAKKALAEGVIGKVTGLYADFFLGPHFGGFREQMPHVLLHDMAIHTFDHCRFLSGLDAVRVTCHETNPAGSWFSHGASATALFELSGGALFSYRGSWVARGFPTPWAGTWRIVGERGTLLWDGDNKIEVERTNEAWDGKAFFEPVEKLSFPPAPLEPGRQMHGGNIGEFLDAIDSGTSPQTAVPDNLKTLSMVEAATESARLNETVTVS